MTKFKFNVGDKARVVKLGSHEYPIGDIVTIAEIDVDCGHTQPYKDDKGMWFFEDEINPVFKVEDKVRIISGLHYGLTEQVPLTVQEVVGSYGLHLTDGLRTAYKHVDNVEKYHTQEFKRIDFEDARVGDYWFVTHESVDLVEGKRYLINKVNLNDAGEKAIVFTDDGGDTRVRFIDSSTGHVERNVSETETEEEFVKGAKYRVIGTKGHLFDKGTVVTFTGEYSALTDLSEFMDDAGKTQYIGADLVERIEDATDEVKPKALKIGDKVRVKGHYTHNFSDGTVGVIIDTYVSEDNFAVKSEDPRMQHVACRSHGKGVQTILDEFLTLVEDDEDTEKSSFKVGDRVVVTEEFAFDMDADHHHFKKGTVGTVIGYSELTGRPYVKADSTDVWREDATCMADKSDNAQYINAKHLHPFTEEVAAVTVTYNILPWKQVKEGSKLLAVSDCLYVTQGSVYEVDEVNPDGTIEFIDDEGNLHTASDEWVLRHVSVNSVVEKGAA